MTMFVSKCGVNGRTIVGSEGPRFLFGEGAAVESEENILDM